MKQTITLTSSTRTTKENPKVLRRKNSIPAIVYGHQANNVLIQCPEKELESTYNKAGENTLIELEVDGKKIPCLIHAASFDPVSGRLEHVDFYAVDMTRKVTAHVPVHLKGESPAVKTLGGILVTVHNNLEVTCLPADLPHDFVIDISVLENFHDSILVSSLQIPSGVTIKNPPDMVIVTVQEPRKEEVVEVVAPVEGATAEGAAAPGAAAPAAGATADKTAEKAPAKK